MRIIFRCYCLLCSRQFTDTAHLCSFDCQTFGCRGSCRVDFVDSRVAAAFVEGNGYVGVAFSTYGSLPKPEIWSVEGRPVTYVNFLSPAFEDSQLVGYIACFQ